MSSGRRENDPSSSHQGASAGHTPNQKGSSRDQSSNQSVATKLAYYRSNTSRLLDFIKQSDQDSLDRFISVVRSGASNDDIFAIIDRLSPGTDKQSSKQNGVSR